MAFLRWLRDGYVALGFLFVWFLSIYMSASLYAHWQIDWINGHFNVIGLLVAIDGLLLFWQAVERKQKRFYVWLGVALACLSLLVILSLIAQGAIAAFFTGLYALSFSVLAMAIIVYGAVELAESQKKEI